MKSYLIMMAVRLLEMKRVLKNTGNIYLHCDPTASHYLKGLMDAVFGKDNFRNEIVWQRTSTHSLGKLFGRVHDTILFYSKSSQRVWNNVYTEHDPEYVKRIYRHRDERGLFQVDNLTGGSVPEKGESGQPWRGIDPSLVGRNWSTPQRSAWPEGVESPDNYEELSVHERLDVLDTAGLIYWPPKGRVPRFKRYLSTSKGRKVHDVITDVNPIASKSKERVGYPTQKPVALLERLLKASSNKKDVVLDPFCGCATTCVAAERLQRHWIGIDISPRAVDLVRMRLENEVGLFGKVIHRTDIPKRSEKLPNYRTHKHTLFGKQEGLCNGCRTQFPFRNMTIDHIVPQSQGSTDHEDNLQLLCGACNSTKGQGTQAELISRLKAQGVLR
jgi:DNA modification methylase